MATLESIQAKIAKLQAQADSLATTKSTDALEKIRGLMEKHAVTVADIATFVGKRRGRKPGSVVAVKQSASAAKYLDPKTGATWTGHGRVPAWIANAKDLSKFLIAGGEPKSAAAVKVPKAGNYVRGPLPPKYLDPKTGATWSGRGLAPKWIAGAKDRSKFLIEKTESETKAAETSVAKKGYVVKKAATEKMPRNAVAAPARKVASGTAKAKAPVVRKVLLPKRTGKSGAPTKAAVPEASAEVGRTPEEA